jgi:hypothetical protein
MRIFVPLLLGILIGAVAAASVLNALRQRDAYPRGLMNVLQHHYARLREDLRDQRCTDAPEHLNALRLLAGEIETAVFADQIADAPFREYLIRLRDALAAAPSGSECTALAPALSRIGEACEACHRQYR